MCKRSIKKHSNRDYIIDLSGKTKKLWSGQASLRRSGSGGRRKNQTKTILYVSLYLKGRHNNI
jgi:hypothetical protein